MVGTTARALAYGAGVPMASNAAGVDPEATYDALTPGAVSSAVYGLTTASHEVGLQSGGMAGYSTFFTGYNAETDGIGRRLSLGRLAGEAVSKTAEGVLRTGLVNNDTAQDMLRRASHFDELGMGAFARYDKEAASKAGLQHQKTTTQSRGMFPGRDNLSRDPSWWSRLRDMRAAHQTSAMRGQAPGPLVQSWSIEPRDIDVDSASIQKSAQRVGKRAGAAKGAKSWAYKAMGLFGGAGYTDQGKADYDVVTRTGPDGKDFKALKRTSNKGLTMLKGSAGRMLGAGFRMMGAMELGMLAADAVGYAAGAGYESMVETTTRLQRRVGGDNSMSGGYYNRAAVTERQRAVRTMNQNQLNPQTQMMGNEAAFMH